MLKPPNPRHHRCPAPPPAGVPVAVCSTSNERAVSTIVRVMLGEDVAKVPGGPAGRSGCSAPANAPTALGRTGLAAVLLAAGSAPAETLTRSPPKNDSPQVMRVFAGDVVPKKKPDPAIYLLAAKELGVNPAR